MEYSQQNQIDIIVATLIKFIFNNENFPLSSITNKTDQTVGLTHGTTLSVFWHLVARKIIPVNIDTTLLPASPISKIVKIDQFKDYFSYVLQKSEIEGFYHDVIG